MSRHYTDTLRVNAEGFDAKQIRLANGQFTLVDDDDYERFSRYRWHVSAKRYAKNNELGYLHRCIAQPLPGQVVDHINGNPLDNRKSNLRVCTQAENNRNKASAGVSFHKAAKKWSAQIQVNKRIIYLGLFPTREDARAARSAAEIIHFGEFRWRGCHEQA